MLGIRFSLFSKIILWFFLNLAVIAAGLTLIFNFRFDSNSRYFGPTSNRIEAVTRQIESETFDQTRATRDEILKKYSTEYKAEFFLFDNHGKEIGGRETLLPAVIVEEITRPEGLPPTQNTTGEPPPPPRPPSGRGAAGPPPSMYFTTPEPTRYWFVGRIMSIDPEIGETVRSRLIVVSDSYTGNGLFFDIRPFILIAGAIIAVSILLWLPFVRNITRDVRRMTNATKQIADEDFDVRVSEKRSDELGTLGRGINHLAGRLAGFVYGQKRFLGDISHELNSPLARMQFAVSILEDRVEEQNKDLVGDLAEELELMTKLVDELLAYSKAGIKAPKIQLERIRLRPLVDDVVRRETGSSKAEIEVDIDESIKVSARPELLTRAFANVVRNAIRYGGSNGIHILAQSGTEQVKISILDGGPGVPEAEIERIFDPLYRLDTHRSRETGGSGLGLAIVKTCIEACQGKVSAENRSPSGLKVTFMLNN